MCIRDRRSADFFRALHLLNPCPCSSVPHFSYLLEVLTGDNRLVSIGKNNPFLTVNVLILDALVAVSYTHLHRHADDNNDFLFLLLCRLSFGPALPDSSNPLNRISVGYL